MKLAQVVLGSVLLLAALASAPAAALADPVRVHLDEETLIGGVDVACTGIGQSRDLPKWSAYPIRVEFADAQQHYLAGETLTLSNNHGAELLQMACEGPWVLLRLPPGMSFKVEARIDQPGVAAKSAMVKAPRTGQARFVLTFPDAH
jgi:hypothetical protein